MSPGSTGVFGLLVFGAWIGCVGLGAPAQDCGLEQKLEMRDSHGGIMEASGTIWMIEPNGHWTVARFSKDSGKPEEVEPPHRQGDLTADQMGNLLAALQVQRFLDLPPRIGTPQRENPHLVTLQLGAKETSLFLGRTVRLEKAVPPPEGPQAEEASRFLNVTRAILKYLPAR
jgi:hypothetical protein